VTDVMILIIIYPRVCICGKQPSYRRECNE